MSDNKAEVMLVVEGESDARVLAVRPEATAAEVLEVVIREAGRTDLIEIFLEDADEPILAEMLLAELLAANKLLHVGSKGLISVVVEYGQKQVSRQFRPSATMDKIVRWAIQPNELDVHAPIEDLQLKHGDDVLPGDLHLGQVTHGHKQAKFSLVFKIKPQG